MSSITLTGDVPSKKNSQQIVRVKKRFIVVSSARHKAWHKATIGQLTGIKPKSDIQSVGITFFPSSKRRSDLTNKAESVMDLLVDAGVIEDDNWWVVPKVELQFGGVDKENPRAEITFH